MTEESTHPTDVGGREVFCGGIYSTVSAKVPGKGQPRSCLRRRQSRWLACVVAAGFELAGKPCAVGGRPRARASAGAVSAVREAAAPCSVSATTRVHGHCQTMPQPPPTRTETTGAAAATWPSGALGVARGENPVGGRIATTCSLRQAVFTTGAALRRVSLSAVLPALRCPAVCTRGNVENRPARPFARL
ncbi:hypothetical protein MTO96_007767 [Rhipicephalus appendiculatus]